jgi:hypothetical protein
MSPPEAPLEVVPEVPLEVALEEELQAASAIARIAGSASRHLRRMEVPGRQAFSDVMLR